MKPGTRYPKISLDMATIELIHALAQREGCSMADCVRRLVRETAYAVYKCNTVSEALAKSGKRQPGALFQEGGQR